MTNFNLVDIINRVSEGEIVQPLPNELSALIPNSELAIFIAKNIDANIIVNMSKHIVDEGRFLEFKGTIVALLHTFANLSRASGDNTNAIAFFENILLLTPEDHNVRVCLFEYSRNQGNHQGAVEILSPSIDVLKGNLDLYGKSLRDFVFSAFKSFNYQEAIKVISVLYQIKSDKELKKISDRIETISTAFPLFLKQIVSGEEFFWTPCLQAMTEHEMINALDVVGEQIDLKIKSQKTVKMLAALLGECISNGWKIAFRKILGILFVGEISIGKKEFCELLEKSGLNSVSTDALYKVITREDFEFVSNSDEANELISNIFASWQEQIRNCNIELVSKLSSASKNKLSEVSVNFKNFEILDEIYRGNLIAQNEAADIWYYITWQNNNEQLMRQIHGLIKNGNHYIVSIGGNRLPSDVTDTTALMNLDNVFFIHRPNVTWGGQKLLFHNMNIAIEAFDKNAKSNSWFQCLCNRSYPIISAVEAGIKLNENDFIINCKAVDPPFSWHIEWSDEVVKGLPKIFPEAIDSVFKECDTLPLRQLAYDDTRYASPAFNFSGSFKVLDGNFKDSHHNYSISPFDVDIRWMSFARMIEFVDTATENNHTFTRMMNPTVLKWAHKVMYKHNLRIGDPFVTFNKKFADVIIHNEDAIELYSAMSLGFGPEMNYFDTVKMSEQYGVRNDIAHLFYRNIEYVASDKYISEAEHSINSENTMFVRKTVPEGANFVKYFAQKNAIAMSDGYEYFSFFKNLEKPENSILLDLDEIWQKVKEFPFKIRDLNGNIRSFGKFLNNGLIVSKEDIRIGGWKYEEGNLKIFFEIDALGQKEFKNFTTTKDAIIFVPDEIVSNRNNWSAFLEWSLEEVIPTSNEEPIIIIDSYNSGNIQWHVASNIDVSMLSCFEKKDLPEYPSAVDKYSGTIKETREIEGKTISLIECGNALSLFELKRIVKTCDRIVRTFVPANSNVYSLWNKVEAVSVNTTIRPIDLFGEAILEVVNNQFHILFDEGGKILDFQNQLIGRWSVIEGNLIIFGLPELSYGKASQVRIEHDNMLFSGWGKSNLKNLSTFRIRFKKKQN